MGAKTQQTERPKSAARSGVESLAKFVWRMRARLGAHGLVLMYHRVAEPKSDPWDLSVSPAHFRDHLEVLKSASTCLTLEELTTRMSGGDKGGSRSGVAVTFDDGYRDNVQAALPILRRASVPATIFVTSQTIGSGREFWWDALTRGLLETQTPLDRITLTLDGQDHVWPIPPLADAAARYETLFSIHGALIARPTDVIDDAVSVILGQIGAPRAGDPANHPMTLATLRDLSATGQVEIGGHTQTHIALPSAPPETAAREIAQGRQDLRDWTGQNINSFAAPYGKQNRAVVEAIQTAGFARAVTVRPGLLMAATDPFKIPRLHVPDMDGEDFERLIRSFLGR